MDHAVTATSPDSLESKSNLKKDDEDKVNILLHNDVSVTMCTVDHYCYLMYEDESKRCILYSITQCATLSMGIIKYSSIY